jgi:hypothetical protein
MKLIAFAIFLGLASIAAAIVLVELMRSEHDRYEIHGSANTVWRLDKHTGGMWLCGTAGCHFKGAL